MFDLLKKVAAAAAKPADEVFICFYHKSNRFLHHKTFAIYNRARNRYMQNFRIGIVDGVA